jgi:hypothetical protein
MTATALQLPRLARKRRSYEERAGLNSRAAKITLKAINDAPEFRETIEGNRVRVWKSSEMSSYSNADVASALRGHYVIEEEEMLATIPPSAIKYAVTKRWLEKTPAGWFYVTTTARAELKLPSSVRGRKIRFHQN